MRRSSYGSHFAKLVLGHPTGKRSHQYRRRIGGGGLQKLWTFRREFFERAIAEQPLVRNRIGAGRRVSQVYTAADFSYRSEKLTGDRWLLAGDAAGFIDPVFSSGVFFAVLAGEQSGGCFRRSARSPKTRPALFRHYERLVNRAMDVYLRFVDRGMAARNLSKFS